jgi:hypothetical protein
MDTGTVIDLLGPVLIALLIYMFVRVSVELHLNVEDCYLSIFQEMASGADRAPVHSRY